MTSPTASSTTRKGRNSYGTFSNEKLRWEAYRTLAKNDLSFFPVWASRGRWQDPPHLRLLAAKLQAVEAGKIDRLMVCMPPRHGKSELVSVNFPAWFLGRNPDERVILTSYGASLAHSKSRLARNLMAEVAPEMGWAGVSDDSAATDHWNIEGRRGGMIAAGVGGPITGEGGNVIIVDDPIKNAEEARSQTVRDHLKEWYKSTLYTRQEPGAAIIVVQTRWHEDDLAGWLLEEAKQGGDLAEKWEVLRLPALAEEDDPLGRPPGAALWPARFNEARLAKIKRALGGYLWAGMYQQRPQPAEGGLFKRQWFRYFAERDGYYLLLTPEGVRRVRVGSCRRFQTCDPAASESDSADYFVLATWAVTPKKDLLLLDVIRVRLEGPDQPNLFRQARTKWGPGFQGVESASFGLTLIQQLVREGLPIRKLEAKGDKVARAWPISARYETGMVYHLAGAPWLADYEAELVVFPNGAHDDQVDVAAYAGIQIADPGPQLFT